jgi:hypothetical protein
MPELEHYENEEMRKRPKDGGDRSNMWICVTKPKNRIRTVTQNFYTKELHNVNTVKKSTSI